MAGKIRLYLGPMFAGKTSEMQNEVRRHTIRGMRVCVLKPEKDTRAGKDVVKSHDGAGLPAFAVTRLSDFDATNYDVIGVDEGQFFDDIHKQPLWWALSGKHVIVAALDGTYKMEPFGRILDLVPAADTVVKLHAVCAYCGEDAPFTRRIVGGDEVVDIGGSDKYRPTCRRHHDGEVPEPITPTPVGEPQ